MKWEPSRGSALSVATAATYYSCTIYILFCYDLTWIDRRFAHCAAPDSTNFFKYLPYEVHIEGSEQCVIMTLIFDVSLTFPPVARIHWTEMMSFIVHSSRKWWKLCPCTCAQVDDQSKNVITKINMANIIQGQWTYSVWKDKFIEALTLKGNVCSGGQQIKIVNSRVCSNI